MPPRLPMVWSSAGMDEATEGAFTEILDRLLQLELENRGDERVPHVLALSSEAAAAWAAFYNAREAEHAVALGVLAAALGRIEAYATQFDLIDHVVRGDRGDPSDLAVVGSDSIEAGVRHCRWFTAKHGGCTQDCRNRPTNATRPDWSS